MDKLVLVSEALCLTINQVIIWILSDFFFSFFNQRWYMQPEGLRFYTSVGVDKFWPGWPEEFCTLSEYFDFWYICLYKSYSQSWRNDRWPNISLNICREILVWRGYLPLVFLVLRISTRFSCASSLLGCYFSHLLWQYCFAWLSFVLSATCFWDLDFAIFFAFRAVWSKLCTHCLYVSCAIIRVQQLSTSIIPINSYGN